MWTCVGTPKPPEVLGYDFGAARSGGEDYVRGLGGSGLV
jgi:hypothetical protein